jgi:hypothetical protein
VVIVWCFLEMRRRPTLLSGLEATPMANPAVACAL